MVNCLYYIIYIILYIHILHIIYTYQALKASLTSVQHGDGSNLQPKSSEMGPNSENDHFIRGSHDTFEPMGSKN